MFFRNYRRRKTWLCNCLKSHVSVHPGTVILLNGRTHFLNTDGPPNLCISGNIDGEKHGYVNV